MRILRKAARADARKIKEKEKPAITVKIEKVSKGKFRSSMINIFR